MQTIDRHALQNPDRGNIVGTNDVVRIQAKAHIVRGKIDHRCTTLAGHLAQKCFAPPTGIETGVVGSSSSARGQHGGCLINLGRCGSCYNSQRDCYWPGCHDDFGSAF